MTATFDKASYQKAYKRNHAGYTAQPFASLVRDVDKFGVVLLLQSKINTDLIVHSWLVRGVSEAEARAVFEQSSGN